MLIIQDLTKSYPGPVEALRGVCLSLGHGIFGLLGPNGAGKSTLMRTLATLQAPDSGSVTLNGVDLLKNPRSARRRIGYLPQDLGAYPRVTAREMLTYLAGLRGIGPNQEREIIVARHLGQVDLLDVADQRLETYSGGMRQRFGIAAAFLGNPELVIVDEPTAGLDPTARRRFQCMLAEAAEGRVLILSSHIVEDIFGLCEQMGIMTDGDIAIEGNPHQLLQEIEGKIWTRCVTSSELAVFQRDYRVLSWRPDRGEIAVRVHAESEGFDLLEKDGFVPGQADLEDLYAMYASPTAPVSAAKSNDVSCTKSTHQEKKVT